MLSYNNIILLIYAAAFCLIVYAVVISTVWIYLLGLGVLYTCLGEIRRRSTGTIAPNGKGIFITGCDTGFGHDLSRRLDELGFTVFAGCLHPEGDGAKRLKSNGSGQLRIVPLDVRKDGCVKAAHDYVVRHLPTYGLWAIVNNAGVHVVGDVELAPVSLYEKAMNVNFYGVVRTIRTFLHLVRETKGRVVVVTSARGIITWPSTSPYHATKFALETVTDALRLEMQKFGVKVSKVQPGNYSRATGEVSPEQYVRYRLEADEMWENASGNVKNTYGRQYLEGMISEMEVDKAGTREATSTKPVIDALVDALMSDKPRRSYLVGGGDGWMDLSVAGSRANT